MSSIHPLSQAEADRVMSKAERLRAYDDRNRVLVPCWQTEYMKSTAQMNKAIPAAANPNGSLKDLATFILAARASEISQCKLLAAEKLAREVHPMWNAEFGS
jgi:hypothetical protein